MAGKVEYGWARSGELYIAYEVRGDAPVDLVLVPGILNPLMASTIVRQLARVDDELARFTRFVKLDKRGTGLSDRFPAGATPTVEERMDDVRAVMDAVGSERACVMGTADGGPTAAMFAATYPERVSSLVLDTTAPRISWAPDWPWGTIQEGTRAAYLSMVWERWGQGVMYEIFGEPEELRHDYAGIERIAGTPAAAVATITALMDTDVRDALSSITAPTVVLHSRGDRIWPFEGAEYLADHIADARLVVLSERSPGDVLGAMIPERIAAIEEIVTGTRPAPVVDRVLKTVLFTDIVGSTERAALLGDREWRALLDAHDSAVRAVVEDHRGDEINTTGDGFLVAFDGPARAIRCAQHIAAAGRDIDVRVRAGIHTGECERRGDDLSGIAVHIGARVSALADGDEVLVTSTVRDLVAGSGIEFEDRGLQELKGVPGQWQVLAVR